MLGTLTSILSLREVEEDKIQMWMMMVPTFSGTHQY